MLRFRNNTIKNLKHVTTRNYVASLQTTAFHSYNAELDEQQDAT